MDDKEYLKIAISQAKKSVEAGGFPAGAIVVKDDKIISRGISIGNLTYDPTSHAEINAIREACKNLNTPDLGGAILYESLSCCTMCFSAAYWSGISKIVSPGKKSNEMVIKGYYEGTTDIEKINQKNNRKIKLAYIPDLLEESSKVIRQWEEKNNL